jgi:5-methylcytosine-specific restriction endonuclease McrA
MIKKCIYCGTEEGPFHRDHIIPYSRGGKDEARNSVDACRPCNYEKGNMTPSEWKLSGSHSGFMVLRKSLPKNIR